MISQANAHIPQVVTNCRVFIEVNMGNPLIPPLPQQQTFPSPNPNYLPSSGKIPQRLKVRSKIFKSIRDVLKRF